MRFRAAVLLCACAAALSCTDPRARPVPPDLDVQFAPTFTLTSPGSLDASIYMFDDDGIATLHVKAQSDDSLFALDSLIGLVGEQEAIRPIAWTVPPGIAANMGVWVRVTVRDFAGFETKDSVRLHIQ